MSFYMEMANEKATDASVECIKEKEYGGRFPFRQENFCVLKKIKPKIREDYFVIECEKLFDVGREYVPSITKALAKGMKTILAKNNIDRNKSVLVVGIGNNSFIADSLGPKTIRNVLATAAFSSGKFEKLSLRKVFAFNPDVCGKTGLQTSKSVGAITNSCKADAVILVDTFASLFPPKLGKTFQFASCGLVPGGGVENENSPITKSELGVPVFSLGVPLVAVGNSIFNEEECRNFVYAPKMIDSMVSLCSEILSGAINQSLQTSLSPKEIEMLKW